MTLRSSGLLVVATALGCVGVWLVVSGWRPVRPSVERAMARLRRPPADPAARDHHDIVWRLGSKVASGDDVVGPMVRRWARPLRLIGRPVELHAGVLVVAAVAGFVLPTVVLGALQRIGVVPVAWWAPISLGICGSVASVLVVHSDAMSTSQQVAVDLRHQVGAYLDMVTMLLAGNTGSEGALDQAARAGDGLLFRELRRRMREVAATGQSLVNALDLVADDYGLVELEQVAATTRLSAAEGAPVARTLGAKCATLRSTLAAEQEATARVRIDRVTPPLVGMALLFMALIIYPALNLG